MKLSEVMDDLDNWDDGMGLSSVNGSSTPNLDYVVNLDNRSMREMDFDEMDEVLEKLSAYMVYLSSQKSYIAERYETIKTVFEYRLHTETERLVKPKSFKTYGERKALVLRTNKKLREMEERVTRLASKLKRLDELPRVVGDRLFTLRKIYDRRVNEHKGI